MLEAGFKIPYFAIGGSNEENFSIVMRLRDGRVFIVGGAATNLHAEETFLSTTEIYTPDSLGDVEKGKGARDWPPMPQRGGCRAADDGY